MTTTIEIKFCKPDVGVHGHQWTQDHPMQNEYLFISKWRDTTLDREDKAGYQTAQFLMSLTAVLSRQTTSDILRSVARNLLIQDKPDELVCYTIDSNYFCCLELAV